MSGEKKFTIKSLLNFLQGVLDRADSKSYSGVMVCLIGSDGKTRSHVYFDTIQDAFLLQLISNKCFTVCLSENAFDDHGRKK